MFAGIAVRGFAQNVHKFQNSDMLPMHVRSFHLWQNELQGLNVGLIPVAFNNEEIAEQFIVPGSTMQETRREKRKRQLRAWLEEQMRLLRQRLTNVVKTYVVTSTYLDKLERAIDTEIERLDVQDPEQAQLKEELDAVKQSVQDAKRDIKDQTQRVEERMEDQTPLSEDEVSGFEQTAQSRYSRVWRMAQFFHTRIRDFFKRRRERRTAAYAADGIDAAYAQNPNRKYQSAFFDDDMESEQHFEQRAPHYAYAHGDDVAGADEDYFSERARRRRERDAYYRHLYDDDDGQTFNQSYDVG